MQLTADAIIDTEELTNSLNEEQAMLLIEQIDLAQAETGFTENVIARLAESLQSEYGSAEIREFLKDLRKSLK